MYDSFEVVFGWLGNELPSEFLQTLLKMAPTSDEELKLRRFNGELSQLGPADQSLKALVDIPFAFKRMEALLFMSTLKEELNSTMESFETLEVQSLNCINPTVALLMLFLMHHDHGSKNL